MKTLLRSFLLNCLVLSGALAGHGPVPPYANWTTARLTLNNGVVQRTINLPDSSGNFLTTEYKPFTGDFNYFQKINPDFQWTYSI